MKGKRSQPKKLPFVLDKSEVERLLSIPNVKCPTGLRNRAMLEIMWGAGLRVSEVVGLRPGDIRWDSGHLEVRGGKGGKDRTIPINGETLGWLRAWHAKRPKRAQRFFCTLKGRPLMARYILAAVKRMAVKAGLENAARVSPHTLRHSYATAKLDEGLSIRDVQQLLGHANVATTEIYTHVRPKELAAKIQRGVFVTNVAVPTSLADQLGAVPADEIKDMLISFLKSRAEGGKWAWASRSGRMTDGGAAGR